jgi:hypothetical protein
MIRQKSIRINVGYLCLIVVLLLTLTNSIYAQSNNQNFYWIDFGIGAGSVGEDGTSVNLNATYQFSKNLLTVRIIGCGEIFGKSLDDYSILYGRVVTSSTILTSFGGGLGIVKGYHGLFSEEGKTKAIIGFPLEAQLFWRPLRFLGLGLYGFANINSEKSYYGCTFSLQIGKLR